MDIRHLRGRIAELDLTQHDLAKALGINATAVNQILNGRRKPPADFEQRATAALDRLERAEKAAQEARQRVLKEEGVVA